MSKTFKSFNQEENQQSDYKNLDKPLTRTTQLSPITDLQTKLNVLNRENQQLKSEICDKVVEAQELQAELTAIRELNDIKDQNLSKLKEELKQATTANSKAAGEQRFLQEQMLLFQQEQEQLLDDYEQALAKIEVLSKEKNQALFQLEELNTRCHFLERQNEDLTNSKNQDSSEIYQLRTQLKEKNEEVFASKQQLENLRNEAKGYIDELHHMHQINERSEETAKGLREEIRRLQSQMDEQFLKTQNTEREMMKAREMSGELKNIERDNRRLEEQLRESNLMLSQKDADLEGRYTEISKLQKSNKELRDDNYTLSSKLVEFENENERLRRSNDEFRIRVDYLSENDKEIRGYLSRKEKMLRIREQAERELQDALDSFSSTK
ncbi:unnamed protein product [Blepharisma stoltei]|uniref:Uncharacterized protein n=1 Tax=Blepharisma stoltei TaxID=1481888 RepID=A0AAU9K7M7_9CILI|nr:unnamed protein product [Blepharisma stoltei]